MEKPQHFVSWNVNGIRAIIKKDFVQSITSLKPDIVCLQETKANEEQTLEALGTFEGYHSYSNYSKSRKGYSGTAIMTKTEPINVTMDMGVEEFDQEGRVVTAEFSTFFLVNVYTCNSGSGLSRLAYRERWDEEFNFYIRWLMKRKPVITCGDFNVAHQEIDLARPKENYNKTSGYTQTEIDGFTKLLDTGLIDSFRHLYPETVKYSYWDYVTNSREKNVGWRIDHFLVDNRLKNLITDALIYNQCYGSDHCPVGLEIKI